MFSLKGTCFYCRQENVVLPGSVLGLHACGSCFTLEPSEAHWAIYRTVSRIAQRKYALAAPEREAARRQLEQERLKRGEMKRIGEMTPSEVEEHWGVLGETLNTLKEELAGMPDAPESL